MYKTTQIGFYPLMASFMGGAFSANSGGKVILKDPIVGTPEEWAEAEEWLRTRIGSIENCYKLGMFADDGETTLVQIDDGEFGDHSREMEGVHTIDGISYIKAAPYRILDRYY